MTVRDTERLPLPRIEAESMPAQRLDVASLDLPPVTRSAPGTLALVLTGASVLVLGLAALTVGNFVVDQFAHGPVLGWASLAMAAAGFGLIGAGIWREMRGLAALRRVDHLRAALAGADPVAARAAARDWVAGQAEAAVLLPALAAIADVPAMVALLRAGPAAGLRARTDALSRTAAVQVFAATAAMPSPLFDGLLVGWRGMRLIRQVAELHGLRPGIAASAALMRRTVLSAAAVITTDVAANTALHAALSNPLLRQFAGDMAGAGVAARRMIVLGRAAAAACTPLPPD